MNKTEDLQHPIRASSKPAGRLAVVIAAASLATAMPAVAGGSKTMKCSAELGKMAHELTLSLRDGEVDGFDYRSVDVTNANSCEVDASRSGASAPGSTWIRQADGSMHVDILAADWRNDKPMVATTATIRKSGKRYELTVVQGADYNLCGIGATIAPKVALIEGKAKCELSDQQK